MDDDSWRVAVVASVVSQTIEMFVYRKTYDLKTEFLTKGGTEVVVTDKHSAAENGLYFASFPNEYTAGLAVEALEKKGIPLPSKDFTAGKLEATEKHLDDMRRLTFDTEHIHTEMQLDPREIK